MEEELSNRKGCATVALFILLFVVIVAVVVTMLVRGMGSSQSAEDEEQEQAFVAEMVSEQEENASGEQVSMGNFVVSEREWRAMQSEVKKLRQDVEQLKSTRGESSRQQVQQKGTSVAAKTDASQPKSASDAQVRSGDVTLASYSHDWVNSTASVALKNNTGKTITRIAGRMVYYDMSGSMLDYQDFTQTITIDPSMTKTFSLSGYGYNDHYAYYKNGTCPVYPDRKYKVKFELKSYSVR